MLKVDSNKIKLLAKIKPPQDMYEHVQLFQSQNLI